MKSINSEVCKLQEKRNPLSTKSIKIECTTKLNMFTLYWEWITKMNEPIKNKTQIFIENEIHVN